MSCVEQIFNAISQFLRKGQGQIPKAAKYILTELNEHSTMESYDQAYFTIIKWIDHPSNIVTEVIAFKKCLHALRQFIFREQANQTLSRYLIRYHRLRESQNV